MLAEEGMRDKVEEDVSEKTACRERDHGVERAKLELGGDEKQDEVRDGGDVKGREDWCEQVVS